VQRFAADGGFRHSFRSAPAGETGRPIGLAGGAGETLWVLDAGDRPALRRFDPSGHHVAERTLAALELEHAAGIATDAAGRLLVLDHDGDRLNLCDADAGAVLWRVELVEYLDRG
jgi:sugar lactone lactonase YvrE